MVYKILSRIYTFDKLVIAGQPVRPNQKVIKQKTANIWILMF